jgi:hypothetical protein
VYVVLEESSDVEKGGDARAYMLAREWPEREYGYGSSVITQRELCAELPRRTRTSESSPDAIRIAEWMYLPHSASAVRRDSARTRS